MIVKRTNDHCWCDVKCHGGREVPCGWALRAGGKLSAQLVLVFTRQLEVVKPFEGT